MDNQGKAQVASLPENMEKSQVPEQWPDNGLGVQGQQFRQMHPLQAGGQSWKAVHLANKMSRDFSCGKSIKVLPPSSQRPSCSGENRQYDSGLLYKSSGLPEVTSFVQTAASGSSLGPE